MDFYRRRIIGGIAIFLLISIGYVLILVYPNVLFAHRYSYKQFDIHSDKPIPTSIEYVIDDTLYRLRKSELFEESTRFKLFLCNEEWRFTFFTRNKSAGGLVNFVISPNIFIRESNIKENRIRPPNGWMLTPEERPLSYFVAHEATHSMQREISPWLRLSTPRHILEGYADYIAKSPAFDYERYRKLYKDDNFVMNPENGLYHKYHLYMAHLIDVQKMSFVEILNTKPELEAVLENVFN